MALVGRLVRGLRHVKMVSVKAPAQAGSSLAKDNVSMYRRQRSIVVLVEMFVVAASSAPEESVVVRLV